MNLSTTATTTRSTCLTNIITLSSRPLFCRRWYSNDKGSTSSIVRIAHPTIMLLLLFAYTMVGLLNGMCVVDAAATVTNGRDMFPISILHHDSTVTTSSNDVMVHQDTPFYIQPADFGSKFEQSVYVNLMLPPTRLDDYLCHYPETLKSIEPIDPTNSSYGVFYYGANNRYTTTTKEASSYSTVNETSNNNSSTEYNPYHVKIGLIVRRGFCTVEQKALVLSEIQQRLNLTGILQYMIVYEDDHKKSNKVVTFSRANTTNHGMEVVDARLKDIGIAYLPINFLKDLENQMKEASTTVPLTIVEDSGTNTTKNITTSSTRGNSTTASDDSTVDLPVVAHPYLLNGPQNLQWQLLFRISGANEPLTSTFVYEITNSNSGQTDNSDLFNKLFWFRLVLLLLLIFGPCLRALYLWYMGGGRILLRRNENGYIIGFQYIPPQAYWFTAGQIIAGFTDTNNNNPNSAYGGDKATVLNEEQFRALPQISYDGIVGTNGSSNNDPANNNEQDIYYIDTTVAAASAKSNKTAAAACDVDTDNVPDDDNDDIENQVGSAPAKITTHPDNHNDSNSSETMVLMASTDVTTTTTTTTKMEMESSHPLSATNTTTPTVPDGEAVGAVMVSPPPPQEPTIASQQPQHQPSTTCTMCSICIDEFILGENLILLPKCKHAFHKSCIHPWLLQRQGVCPLCKTPVLVDNNNNNENDTNSLDDGETAPDNSNNNRTNTDNENPVEERSGLSLPMTTISTTNEPQLPTPTSSSSSASSGDIQSTTVVPSQQQPSHFRRMNRLFGPRRNHTNESPTIPAPTTTTSP